MSDTLRERLAAMRSMTSKYNALLAQHEAISKYRELPDDSAWPIIRELLNERAWAIAELDRLEAEVKKLAPSTEPVQAAGEPWVRLPIGWDIEREFAPHSLIRVHGPAGHDGRRRCFQVTDTGEPGDWHRDIHDFLWLCFFSTRAPAEVPNQGQRSQTPMNTETAKEYVGWTCGGCGGPVAGRFSTCENCGLEPMSSSGAHLKKTAAEKPKPVSLVDVFEREGIYLDEWCAPDVEWTPVSRRHFACGVCDGLATDRDGSEGWDFYSDYRR